MMGARHFIDIHEKVKAKDSAGQIIPGIGKKLVTGYGVNSRTVSAGESIRGRQMQPTVNLLLVGQHLPGIEVTPQHIALVHSEFKTDAKGQQVRREIGIVAAYDPDGMGRELHIQGREDR
jgi:hypothetical protein